MSLVEAYAGEIRLFTSGFAPRGWALCDGRLLPIEEYPVLFALIGTTYGGDGMARPLRCLIMPGSLPPGADAERALGRAAKATTLPATPMCAADPSNAGGQLHHLSAGRLPGPSQKRPARGPALDLHRRARRST
jgi:hypothetical protein